MNTPPQKLAKLMARAGYGSRRDCEALIQQGRVSVDGVLVDRVAERFPEHACITVKGMADQRAESRRVWCFHKPAGLVTSHRDERYRPTVFDVLPKKMGRVVSVGRLDLSSEGLLLLTNDGGYAGALEKSDIPRQYRVRVQGQPKPEQLKALADGVVHEGIMYAPVQVELERTMSGNSWLRFTLTEGKNREIRRLVEFLGFRVNRLIRTGFGAIELGDLAQTKVRELSASEINSLN